MNCPWCGSKRADSEHLPTGDWYERFECGSEINDNDKEQWFRSDRCKRIAEEAGK